jgi:hypothetical protein
MSSSGVIGDVTETLQALLTDKQVPLNHFEISLKSPADEQIQQGMKPKVNLFLFRVVEDTFSRNQEWVPVGSEQVHYPPLILDLYYLLTSLAEDKLDEHRVFGEAMRILHDFPTLQGPLLRGGLRNSGDELSIGRWHLEMEDLGRIWSAMTKPYRLTVGYQVRTVLIDSSLERDVRRVLEKEERFVGIAQR